MAALGPDCSNALLIPKKNGGISMKRNGQTEHLDNHIIDADNFLPGWAISLRDILETEKTYKKYETDSQDRLLDFFHRS